MASTYSPNLSIELIGTGDQAGTWGNTTNTNLGTLIEQAISGYVTQAVSTGTDTTITIPNGATGVARNMYIELTGTGGASTNLIVPANRKLYFIFNNTSSGQVTVKVSGQTGISVPNKAKVILVSNGTDVIDATNYIGSAVIGNLTATSGTITTLASTSAIITTLSSGSANITQLNSTSGTISTLASTSAAITTLSGTTLTYSSASITNLTATSLVLSNLSIASANITTLTSGSATITNLINSGGTVNGVLYLNGSKAATSGSALVFDGSNLGLGVTPSAWATPAGIDIGSFAGFGQRNDNGWAVSAHNSYFSSTGWRYKVTGIAAAYYGVGSGTHQWFTAASGTAGNTITFTQAMTLDASGNLGVGTTSPSGKIACQVTASGTFQNALVASDGSSSDFLVKIKTNETQIMNSGASVLSFGTSNTERARITSGGAFYVGDTTAPDTELVLFKQNNGTKVVQRIWNPATSGDNGFVMFATETANTNRGSITYNRAGGLVAYNTTSDYRAKDIISQIENVGSTIDALKVYIGKMKGATIERPMLIAHEAQEVTPYAVTGEKDAVNEDGTPKYQQMDHSSLVPLLIAEIQSLRARVAQLESK